MYTYTAHIPNCILVYYYQMIYIFSLSVGLTFNVEIHGLADISPDIVADSTQVEAAVFLQHMFDKERAVDQHLDSKA